MPKAAKPRPPDRVDGIAEALDRLERRRRAPPAKRAAAGRRDDLDLDGIR